MKELLDRIIAAKYRENTFFYQDPIRPEPGAPATAEDLEALDRYLAGKGLAMPPSYRAFVSVYDGIRDVFAESFSLLSIRAIVGGEIEILEENLDEFPQYCEFVIGGRNTPAFIGFDITACSPDGEYEVVEVSPEGDEARSKNFTEFLSGYLSAVDARVQAEVNDRENLPE